jgi:hypothetical protein
MIKNLYKELTSKYGGVKMNIVRHLKFLGMNFVFVSSGEVR